MTLYEVDAALLSNNKLYKDSWEKNRWLGYITACAFGAKLKSPQDLIKFSWEIEKTEIQQLSYEDQKAIVMDAFKGII